MNKVARKNTMIFADLIGILGIYISFFWKNTILDTNLIIFLGCSIAIIEPNIYSILTGRFIQGIACGINTVAVPVYIKEMTPLSMLGGTSILNPVIIFIYANSFSNFLSTF